MTELVVARDLTKVFRTPFLRRRVEALRGVTFAVPAGSITGFLGANGAGKTTTLKLVLGLLTPTFGSATLFGHPVPARLSRERVGFLPEAPAFPPNLSGAEIVSFAARLQGIRDVDRESERALARVGLERAAWHRAASSLSKGQAQRVGLAAALASTPDLLILDEPMSGLDPIGRSEVRALIADEHARGCTVLFSTHILSDAEELCSHVRMLDRGRIVVDAPLDTLLAEPHARFFARFSDGAHATYDDDASLDVGIREALVRGASIRELTPLRRRLQDVFDAHVSRG